MTLLEQIKEQVSALPPEKQAEVLDFIAFLQQRLQNANAATPQQKRRQRLKEAFATLAASGAFAEIEDPVQWQREIRKDRPLHGRDE
jgi:hypothetical protein